MRRPRARRNDVLILKLLARPFVRLNINAIPLFDSHLASLPPSSAMSSTETIDQARSDILLDFPLYLYLTNVRQLWSNIAAKLRGYKIDGLETDLDLLKKEVQGSINVRDGVSDAFSSLLLLAFMKRR